MKVNAKKAEESPKKLEIFDSTKFAESFQSRKEIYDLLVNEVSFILGNVIKEAGIKI